VGAAFTDRLAAWAEGGDGDGDGDLEAEIFPMKCGIEAGLVVDQAGGSRDWGLLFNEVREVEFEMSGVGLQAFLKGAKNGGYAFHVDQASMFLQDFDETAHVGPLELVRKVNGQGHGGNGVLGGVSPITNDDRVTESFDAHLVNPEVAKIRRGLGVLQEIGLRRGLFQRMIILPQSQGEGKWGGGLDSDGDED